MQSWMEREGDSVALTLAAPSRDGRAEGAEGRAVGVGRFFSCARDMFCTQQHLDCVDGGSGAPDDAPHLGRRQLDRLLVLTRASKGRRSRGGSDPGACGCPRGSTWGREPGTDPRLHSGRWCTALDAALQSGCTWMSRGSRTGRASAEQVPSKCRRTELAAGSWACTPAEPGPSSDATGGPAGASPVMTQTGGFLFHTGRQGRSAGRHWSCVLPRIPAAWSSPPCPASAPCSARHIHSWWSPRLCSRTDGSSSTSP